MVVVGIGIHKPRQSTSFKAKMAPKTSCFSMQGFRSHAPRRVPYGAGRTQGMSELRQLQTAPGMAVEAVDLSRFQPIPILLKTPAKHEFSA